MHTLQWKSGDAHQLNWSKINETLEADGYMVLQCGDAEYERLTELGRCCGSVRFHERSDVDGVTEVRAASDGNDVFRGLTSGMFPPHTDGAYLDTFTPSNQGNQMVYAGPPALFAFQCVRAAEAGGEAVLVDGAEVVRAIRRHNPELLAQLTSPGFTFVRKTLRAVNLPIFQYVGSNRVRIRFLDKLVPLDVRISAKKMLYHSYLASPSLQFSFKMQAGWILLIDNYRMLHGRYAFGASGSTERFFRRLWLDPLGIASNARTSLMPEELREAFAEGSAYKTIFSEESCEIRYQPGIHDDLLAPPAPTALRARSPAAPELRQGVLPDVYPLPAGCNHIEDCF